MDHDEWLELISAEADGELSGDDSVRLADHLADCGSCTLLLSRLETDRRRARLRVDPGHDLLLDRVLAARSIERDGASRAGTVLVRRGAVALAAVAAAAVALLILPSGGTAPSAPRPQSRNDALIAAKDQSFDRADIEIKAGTTVEWQNAGTTTHHLVRDLGAATVDEDLLPGRTETATFEQPGTYEYHCTIHDGMAGTVTVDA